MSEIYKNRILLVEDDVQMVEYLRLLLETEGYRVLSAGSCKEGRSLFASHRPDLVILDLGLPDGDGTELLSAIREKALTPVIVLSARSEESDKVDALDLGANDYVTKPFGAGELLARIRSVIRSARTAGGVSGENKGTYRSGPLTVDYGSCRVTLDGEEIHLTRTEYNVLCTLTRNGGKIMTYSAIIREVWGEDELGSTKKLQVNMANIRKKLGSEPGKPQIIENLIGIGYRME